MPSEKNKTRLTWIVILLVFVSITAYSLNVESKEKITIDEGYDEISVEYLPDIDDSKTFQNKTTNEWYKNATAKTMVNGINRSLKQSIIIKSITSSENNQIITVKFQVKGEFISKYNFEDLLLTVKGLDDKKLPNYHYDFMNSFLKKDNLKKWPNSENNIGNIGTKKSYIGFDVDKNDFSVETQFQWTVPRKDWGNNYTIRTQSILKGTSQKIITSIDITLTKRVIQ